MHVSVKGIMSPALLLGGRHDHTRDVAAGSALVGDQTRIVLQRCD